MSSNLPTTAFPHFLVQLFSLQAPQYNMATIHSTHLPGSLDPLSTSFAKLSTAPAPAYAFPGSTTAPIVDPEAIKKAIFDTAYEPSEKLWADNQAAYVKPFADALPEGFPDQAVGPHVWEGKELAKNGTLSISSLPIDS